MKEPIATSSIVDVFRLASARQDVKVVLIGQGPDELFGGYKRHLGVRYGNWWRGLPSRPPLHGCLRSQWTAPERNIKARCSFARKRGPTEAIPGCILTRAGRDHRWTFRDHVLPGSTGHELADLA